MNTSITIAAVVTLITGMVVVFSADLRAAEPGKAEKPSAAKAGPIKVVIIVGGHGYDRKNFPKAWGGHKDILCEVRDKHMKQPYSLFDDVSNFKYDVILMYNLSSGITKPQQQNFLKLLKQGVGLVVWHHALGNCQKWPEFEKIAGGKFWMRSGQREDGTKVGGSGTGGGNLKMHIEDPNHPITKGMKDFEVRDETYNRQTFTRDIHVLVSTDHPRSDKPIAWTNLYGKARVFTYQTGHDARSWTNPSFQRLMARGIRWVAGRLGDKQSKPPAKTKQKPS